MSRIERVVYRTGFVKRFRESRHLPAITIEAADLPDDVLVLLDPQHHLDLASAYGDPKAGDPIQYDEVSKKPAKESCGSPAPRSCAARHRQSHVSRPSEGT